MKEFIDKLISRLEEKEKTCHDMALDEIMNNGHSIDAEHLLSQEDTYGNIIRIVNKLAEEYNKENDDTDYANIELYNFWLKHQWTSCKKELPPQPKENPLFENKPLELYLVSLNNTDYPWRAFWNGKFFTDGWSRIEPNAWMPLPAPYTEGE